MPELATSGNAFDKRRFSRRGFLGAGIASGFALAACASKPTASGAAGMTAAIDAAEAARPVGQPKSEVKWRGQSRSRVDASGSSGLVAVLVVRCL